MKRAVRRVPLIRTNTVHGQGVTLAEVLTLSQGEDEAEFEGIPNENALDINSDTSSSSLRDKGPYKSEKDSGFDFIKKRCSNR